MQLDRDFAFETNIKLKPPKKLRVGGVFFLREFLHDHELKLTDAQRLPPSKEMPSTEILESCFGLFKQLERQHSKGGFTSLLASFGALLQPATPELVRTAFRQVSVKQMRTWVSNNLGTTVPSKRQTAYAESKTTA